MDRIVQVTERMLNGKEYNGSEEKYGVTVNGIDYIMKMNKKNHHNVLSEYLASNFIEQAGGSVHHVLLGVYKGEQVALCQDFTRDFGTLRTLAAISSSSIDTDQGQHEYYFDDVVYMLSNIHNMDAKTAIHDFFIMYVFDTILGNTDRHLGNWGICEQGSMKYLAPIFDNGASLYPRNFNYSMPTKEWMEERVCTFPNSKIMFQKSRERSSYYKVWQSDVIPADIRAFSESIDLDKAISNSICKAPIEMEEKLFYAFVIECRYNGIILGEEDFYEKAVRRYYRR